MLAPIYVWGAYASPGGWTSRTTLGFLLVHLALYPGANAFNTAYDRDTGPIGGLARPPAVPGGLAGWSASLQAVGAAMAPLVGWRFTIAYLGLWAIFTAYSHPRTRWKRSPWLSTPVIVGGQGGLGWYLGWVAAAGPWPPGARGWWSLTAACAAVAALYPVTQVYQREADAARRDRTLAAALGVHGTLLWCGVAFAAVAGPAWALGLASLALYALAVALAAGVAALIVVPGWAPSHGQVMAVAYLNSTAILGYLLVTWG